MKIPLQPHRIPTTVAATALLLPGDSASALLHLCIEVGTGAWPRVYRIADGFLVLLPKPQSQPRAGVIRLRQLGPQLFVPVDAVLQPALLADEAAALTRQRGLVFLPGGRVLAYDPNDPVGPEMLVAAPRRPPRTWRPPSIELELPARLQEIRLDVPESALEELLNHGQGDIGTETPRPPDASPTRQWLSKLLFGLGKGVTGMGRSLSVRGLARLGAGWMAAALQMAPRLTEELIGKQEAALRELLRQFREGNTEQALRQALPLSGADNNRLGLPAANPILPMQNILYSLASLLGGGGRGPVSVWYGPIDLHVELSREYLKQANLAMERGDFRRAAYIFGRLLGDFRQAAAALERGGLYRDAAILYERKLLVPLSAARCYEAAGDHDRALQIYRSIGEYEKAGDLLVRLGEPDRALVDYLAAAEKLIRQQRALHLAGDLLLNKAQREDLALENYQAGWSLRPDGPWFPCLQRLVERRLARGELQAFLHLESEANRFFRQPGHVQDAETFYNDLAARAQKLSDQRLADDLRDRCLGMLALKMRDLVTADALGTTLTNAGGWPQALRNDCHQALQRTRKRRKLT